MELEVKKTSALNCIKDFLDLLGESGHSGLTLQLFSMVILVNQFDVTIVSNGNNCNVKPDWPESPLKTVVKSNLNGQTHPVNQGNPLYN